MHRITRPRADYYLSDLGHELPLGSPGGAPGARWTGESARQLGLTGAVRSDDLVQMLDGCRPGPGTRLRSDRASVLGYDLTFSAPKSASILFALGGEEVAGQIVEAHHRAVGGALTYVERHMLGGQRRIDGARPVVGTDGAVAAAFTHGVNRNQDPHVHTHVVMGNLVHGTDGKWSALDQRGVWAHREAAGAVYESHLRAELTARLTVRWEVGADRRSEISGISPMLMGEFSSRRAEIRRHMFEHGVHSARGNRIAWAATRPEKQPVGSYGELEMDWTRRALGAEATRGELLAVVGRTGAAKQVVDEHLFRGVLSETPDGAVRRRDLTTALAISAADGASAVAVDGLTGLWLPEAGDAAQVSVAETTHLPRQVVPNDSALRELGPRPLDPGQHQVWRDAAQALNAYRSRWGVQPTATLEQDMIGLGRTTMPTRRLVDHLRTTQTVDAALARLGRRRPMELELGRSR